MLREQLEEQGFVVVNDVFDPLRDLQPVIDDYAAVLDELAEHWYAEVKITSSYRELPFSDRFMKVIAESCQPWSQYFDISLPQRDVTEETPIHLPEAVFNLLRTPRLLDLIEQIIGPEIYSNPIQHVRIKPPERLI